MASKRGVQGGGLTLLTRMIHRDEHIVTIGGGRAYWTCNNEVDKQYIGRLPYDLDMIPRAQHCLLVGSSEPHKWFPIRTGANDKYLQRLDANMASIIRDNVGDVAEAFGYHPPTDVAGERTS